VNVPVLSDVGEVVGNDGPDSCLHPCGLPVRNEVVGIRDQGSGSQGGPVSLRTAPVAVEARPIRVVFGLSQTSARGEQRARWVVDGLQDGLGVDVVLNVHAELLVSVDKLVNERLERQGGISAPGVEVCVGC